MTSRQTATCSTDLAAAQAEIERLNRVVEVLMDKIERDMNAPDSEFGLLRATLLLESQVQCRTHELENALRENRRIIRKLEDAHGQLLQSEKLASIGQLAAGVAHEINNPIAFVSSNLNTLTGYARDLLKVLAAYEEAFPEAAGGPLAAVLATCDLDYIREDMVPLVDETIDGADRVQKIVRSLRDFAREDDKQWEEADLHAGLESTINVVWSELKQKADVVREYGAIPLVECRPAQLNQVFMNLLVNAAQAIEGHGRITIRTRSDGDTVSVIIADDGPGMPPDVLARIFDPFYTTKPVGKGTGLGLSLCYGIIEKHGGRIDVESVVGAGTTFTVSVPVRRVGDDDAQQHGGAPNSIIYQI